VGPNETVIATLTVCERNRLVEVRGRVRFTTDISNFSGKRRAD